MALPQRYQIALYWHEKWPESDLYPFVDIGEPACFACGYYAPSWDSRRTPEQRWNKSGLERAHIIARSIGGDENPENFVLLCCICHESAPMTADPSVMLEWCRRRPHFMLSYMQNLRAEIFRLGVSAEQLNHGLGDAELLDSIIKELQIGQHFSAERGTATSLGTFAAVVARYFDRAASSEAA